MKMINEEIEFCEEEFFDSEAEPSFCEEYAGDESLNESIASEQSRTYYAVQFKSQIDTKTFENTEDRIFIHQENAIKVVKKDPTNRRFKSFKSFHEAYTFSYEFESSENIPSRSAVKASIDPCVQKVTQRENSVQTANLDAEKLPFSAPKKPEINQLRAFIEKNDIESFRAKIIANPRFLVSAGDTPILCQESFRYNCLHVCAKENRPEICDFLLKTLNSTAYIQKLYRTDSLEQSKIRCEHLLDLYLNMPEKGLNETPLHFACKFGSLEVVRLLISSEICNKNVPNKFGKTPKDLICTKAVKQEVKDNAEAIKSLFEDCFYVTLYRDEERGDVVVDRPSPKLSLLQPNSNLTTNKYKFSPSMNKSGFDLNNRKLAAYVGPVSPQNANAIYDRLKSPARLRQSPNNLDILRGDDFKGYERIVRQLTDEMKLPWSEFWAFLNGFTDLKTKQGLLKLEIYLEQKKFLSILEFQMKTAKSIKLECDQPPQLNYFNPTIINAKSSELVQILDELCETIGKLKKVLDLNENVLSLKFEQFAKGLKPDKTSNEKKFAPVDNISIEEVNLEELKKILQDYMNIVIAVCKINKDSTQCYFDIYKTSKSIFELLHFEDMYRALTFSPVDKKMRMFKVLSENKDENKKTLPVLNKTLKRLTPKKKEQVNPFLQMRTSKKDLLSDDEDEYDEIARNINLSCDDENNQNAKDNIQQNKTEPCEIIDLLASKLTQGMKLEEKPLTIADSEDECYTLNNIDNLKPKFNGFKKPADIKGICKTNQPSKLFMYGDAPSKLDRAVYFAIKNIKENLDEYSLLNEWFNFMNTCNNKEMNNWKTPMRRNIHFNNC